MKLPLELHYVAGWLVFFVLHTAVMRYVFLAGTTLSTHFPSSPAMRHVCILSGIALSLVLSYLLFRTIVKKYLVRKSRDEATPTI
jgi:amino acid transporter